MKKTALNLPCFAKINLTLRVIGKREDGYHEISTIFQTISVHDQLIVIHRDDERIDLSCNERRIPTDDSNLVMRAAKALKQFAGVRQGAELALLKRIPAKAGLGGGSSNAAATLLGLNELWECGLSIDELSKLGSDLGADVPFFFYGGTASGTGTGSRVSSLSDQPTKKLVIITPAASVSTKDAYKALNAPSLTSQNPISILTSSFAEPVLNGGDQSPLHNDFEAVIFEMKPEIERAKNALLDAGARGALLTGSGSSVFGLFDDDADRQRGINNLEIESGWRVFSCSTISRSEYCGAMGSAGVSLS